MRSDIAISIANLSKSYRIFAHPGDRIKQVFAFGRTKYFREFNALKNITFSVKRGETVGIIGRNGSGKSTLLQLACGILKPTSGFSSIKGRVSALLELGAGFNPEFTGRENVYFQAAILGIPKDTIDQRFQEIAEFADIGEFIDQPVRTYSSGMFVRLAFSVAIHVQPDVLIVDEALSVGDAAFQHKSMNRVQELISSGASLLLVSHDRHLITSICQRCILLDRGELLMDGLPTEVFDYYRALTAAGSGTIHQSYLSSGQSQVISGSGEARVENVCIRNSTGVEVNLIDVGKSISLQIKARTTEYIPILVIGISIRDKLGHIVFNTNSNCFRNSPVNIKANSRLTFTFDLVINMGPGNYSISTYLTSTNDQLKNNYESRELAYLFEVTNELQDYFFGSAWLQPDFLVQIEEAESS